MAEIRVSSTQLNNEAEALLDLAVRLKTAISALQNDEATLNGMWDGEANDQFHKAFNSDIGQMNAFYNLIISFARVLLQIAAKYEAAEARNYQTAVERKY